MTLFVDVLNRPSDREGSMGGNPPINFEQRVTSTCPKIRRSALRVRFGSVFIDKIKGKRLRF